MSVNPECIGEILDALVGSTRPVGSTDVDEKHQQNVPAFAAVCEWVARRINQANQSYDSPYGSERVTARMVMRAAGDLSLLWDVEEGRCGWLKVVE